MSHTYTDSPREDSKGLLSTTTGLDYEKLEDHLVQRRALPSFSQAIWFFTTVVVAALLGVWVGYRMQPNLDAQCSEFTSVHSPIFRDVDISYAIHRFNGSLLKENVYRLSAGPEVDAAWNSLGVDNRTVIVPYDDGIKAGMAADQVKVNPRYGGGFIANVEGLHQLHCLNVVRQALYYNFDYYREQAHGAFSNSDHIIKLHVSHCVDIIRQQLMCTMDVGMLGQVWFDPSAPEAYVDFNTYHKCRNFDDVRQWAKERQVPEETPEDFLQQPEEGDLIYETIP